MPTYVRWRKEGASYFCTVVTYLRQRILPGGMSRDLLRTALTTVRRLLPLEISAIVLLSDHLHCIWSLQAGEDDFRERWRRIKGRFSHDDLAAAGRDWSVTNQRRDQGRVGVWQPRYWEHRLRD